MGNVTGIQFEKNGKLYYFDSNGFNLKIGDYAIVDTVRGLDLGEVIMASREVGEETWNAPLKKVVRAASEQDIQHARDNRVKEKDAFVVCQKKIAEHKLEMKLVSVEYAFDNSKILFYFTANGRVDFRSLVKDLASVFKMRIELRQIGVRDEAKMLGGLGPCGRQICCGSFLEQFQPVSIKMAKEQNLSLNPTKISGVCGRLMCCLKYEQDHYEQARKRMPKVGREVSTPDGAGPVTDLNIVKETVFVRLTNGDTSEIKEYPLDAITRVSDQPIPSPEVKNEKRPETRSSCAVDANGDISVIPQGSPVTEQTISQSEKNKAQAAKADQAKNRNRSRRGTLGQPVRRENPNRNQNQATSLPESESNVKPAEKTNEKKPSQKADETATARTDNTSGSWADALQKAMLAIDQNK